ncbi:uncharacterized protein LOC106664738 [Cimex lectularius]|uniref:Uncharacterized protein n=1 Tax=Cimex lectularius TaxID=79782 RepID=A0A8I6RM73_CIMLE|nr:uncharacterized protein LOC106664738 [Cimex lectularius]
MKAVFFLILVAVVSGEKTSNEPVKEEAHEPPKKYKPFFTFPYLPTFQHLLPSVSFPQLHLPHLPALPHLPTFTKLPAHFKKETVTATKTVYVELTKRVTRHPICVTAYGIQPPCLGESYEREVLDDFEENMDQLRKHQITPTPVPSIHVPATRVLGSITESEVTMEEAKEVPKNEETNHRQGRYIVRHPIPMMAMEVRSEPDYRLVDSEKEKLLKGLLKATHHITQTIWVTKIEKIYDHAVTATLVAKNCFPTDPKIPLCGPIHTEPNRFSGPIDDGGYYGGLFAGQPAPVPASHISPPVHHEIVAEEHSHPDDHGPEGELEHGAPVAGSIHGGTVTGGTGDWKDENAEDKETNP